MIKRIHATLIILEAGAIGLFFVQALRYLIGAIYSRIASASLITNYPAETISPDIAGYVDANVLNNEIILLGLFIALPVLMIVLGRWRYALIIGVILAAGGRALINNPTDPITALMGAGMAVSGGLIYITSLSSHRARTLPYFFILGLAADQLIRTSGNTLDPTLFNANFATFQIGISVAAVIVGIITLVMPRTSAESRTADGSPIDLDRGILTFWSAIGLGGLLFLELSLLALPNAIASRTQADYTMFAPVILVATLLPLIPEIRAIARRFIAPFDASTRGWIWMIVLALLIVIGLRVPNITVSNLVLPIGAVALALAQFAASMIWWWFVRPRTEREMNIGGLWMVLAMFIFGLLVIFDIFTYEYAFVRELAAPLDSLNAIIPPMLRGFRGLGLAVILLASFLAILPMIQATRRVPWTGGKFLETLMWFVIVTGATVGSAYLVRPPQVAGVSNVDELRIGTYNIHSGYSEFFAMDLEGLAQAIESGGVKVVLLQEVEAGRLTSFGVDQSLWLARRLGMDRRFYATNEGMFGLAVLSQVPIVFDDGELLPSQDQQTGIQRVQIQPDDGAITLYNTSLGLLLQGPGLTTLEDNQRTQLMRIINIIAAHVESDYGGQLGRTVLGGTFHNVPSSPLMQIPQQYGFTDPFAGTNLELSATLNRSNLPPARYDYLWLWSQSLQAIGTNVIPSDASDHRLAVVGIRISGN